MQEVPSQVEALNSLSDITQERGLVRTLRELMPPSHLSVDGSTMLGGVSYVHTEEMPLNIEGLGLPVDEVLARFTFRSVLVYPEAAEFFPRSLGMSAHEAGVMTISGMMRYWASREGVGDRTIDYCFKPGVAQLLDTHFEDNNTVDPKSIFGQDHGILRASASKRFTLRPTEANDGPRVDAENAAIHRLIDQKPHLTFLSPELGFTPEVLPQLATWAEKL